MDNDVDNHAVAHETQDANKQQYSWHQLRVQLCCCYCSRDICVVVLINIKIVFIAAVADVFVEVFERLRLAVSERRNIIIHAYCADFVIVAVVISDDNVVVAAAFAADVGGCTAMRCASPFDT